MLQQLVAMNTRLEERRAGYYGGAKIRHNNACAGIAGYQ